MKLGDLAGQSLQILVQVADLVHNQRVIVDQVHTLRWLLHLLARV